MSLVQSRPSRIASQQSMEKTLVILNEKDVSDVDMVEVVDTEKCKKKNKNEVKTSGKLKSTNIVPIVTQKSRKYDLNYFKQFSRRLEHCERDPYRIHDPIKNKNDHGSKDHGLVYVEFNAGLFQAMKTNMMKIAKDYNITLAADPKIELYGNAEERMLLDLKVIIKGQEHLVKMKVYNTTCGMDFQALKHDLDKKFDHLDGRTVGEFFTQEIVVEIANTLCNKVDIKKLNNYIKKLALDGKDGVKAVKKCFKFDCTKDTSKGVTIVCIYCESYTHKSCISDPTFDVTNYRCESCFINNVRTIQSGGLLENENILMLSLLNDDPNPDQIDSELNNHISHKSKCTICNDIFPDETALKTHTDLKHEARKRFRGDTSLIEGRCDCADISDQYEIQKNELQAEKERIKEMVHEIDTKNKLINEKNARIQTLEDQADELVIKMNEITCLKDTIKKIEEELEKKASEFDTIRQENDVLKRASEEQNNQEPRQELQRLRTFIQDREKTIKKAADEHKKELTEYDRARINAEENLNSAIQENTKIKEKESTMYKIMEGLRKLLDLKNKDPAGESVKNKATATETESEVKIINDGAVGGTIPKVNSFSCEKCKFTAQSMQTINKHVRQEHLSTLYPCVTCDHQAKSMQDLRTHEKNHFKCDLCSYVAQNKGTLTKEQSRIECNKCSSICKNDKHGRNPLDTSIVSLNCDLCSFQFKTQSALHIHEQTVHMKSKYQCDLCTNYFTKPETLSEHKAIKHNVGLYPCNECGYKSTSLDNLDEHIKQHHGDSRRDKNIDMRDLSDRIPCDPTNPNHTSECCDRDYNYSNNKSEEERRRTRGQCRYWNQGRCDRGNRCRFAHIKLCKYQDQCLYYESCGYLHQSEKESFLDLRSKRNFVFREEDFPPLGRFQGRRKNL